MRLEQAKSAATGVGLGIAWPEHCDDIVTGQSPSPGARVATGTRVTVELPQTC
jgi:hypothetical protein